MSYRFISMPEPKQPKPGNFRYALGNLPLAHEDERHKD